MTTLVLSGNCDFAERVSRLQTIDHHLQLCLSGDSLGAVCFKLNSF